VNTTPDRTGLRVLLLDDDAGIRDSVCAYLEDCNMQVVVGGNGQDGLRILHGGERFDVAVVDLRMPGMDGYQFLSSLVSEGSTMPVVVLSGVGVVEDAMAAIRLGAVGFVSKPISSFAILQHEIDSAVTKARLVAENIRHQENLEKTVASLVETQQMLARSEERLSSIVSVATDAMVLVDEGGTILHWNPAAERLLGYEAGDAAGLNLLERVVVAPQCRQAFEAMLHPADCAKQGEGALEMIVQRRDGSTVHVEVSYSPTACHGHRSSLLVLHDITERKRLESLKNDVDSITRHDLKAPLSAVIGLPQEILDEYAVCDDIAESLMLIRQAGYVMLEMINRSLDLYHMENGTYVFNPSPVDLRTVARRVVAEQAGLRRERGVRVEFSGPGGLERDAGRFLVRGDAMLCYSMLSNTLKNAIEASPEGGVVSLAFLAGDPMEVRVHNAGAVPEPMRGVFFEKRTTCGKPRGTGLGTYSARLMALTQGGDMGYVSGEEEGTTVWFRLPPALPGQEPDAAGRGPKKDAGGGLSSLPAGGRGLSRPLSGTRP